jgi:raffinose/stachyose/melibiose transport system permease protein
MAKFLRFGLNMVLFIFSITCIFPIVWILYSSLKTQAEFAVNSVGLPHVFTFANYFSVIRETNMLRYMLNSAIVSVVSVVAIIVLAFILSYFLARFSFKGRNFIYTYLLLGMLLPIHALLVPIYINLRNISMLNRQLTLVLPYVAFGLPAAMVLTEAFIRTIPRTFEEAAAIDGSSFTRTLCTIIFPLTMPILATITIIQFFGSWNEFSFSLVLISDDYLRTIPVGLTMFKSIYEVNYPRLMAGMMASLLPVMILYFIFSDRIIQGMTAGAIKG